MAPKEARRSPVAGGPVELHAGRGPENPGVAPKEARRPPVAGGPVAPHAGRGPKNPGMAPEEALPFKIPHTPLFGASRRRGATPQATAVLGRGNLRG